MKKLILSIACFASVAFANAQNWKIDNSHSKVQFSVTHMMIAETSGKFKVYDGSVVSSKEDFTDAQINFSIDVNSIDTDDEMRDKHLKSGDFFDVEKFPKMVFKSKSLKKVAGKNYKLTGELTIKDVTKPVEFDVVYNGTMKDPYGNTRAGFKLAGNINRTDFGLKWNAVLEAGGVAVSENVDIDCNVELIKQK